MIFAWLILGFMFGLGYAFGYAHAAKKAAGEHRENAQEFAEIRDQVRGIKARAEEHLP